jgi:AraC family 4-hydroxyphenylacetate 3-monooxygenase operon regulatory protein
MGEQSTRSEWIPNIVVGQEYDAKYADAQVHYDSIQNFASFFGHDMPVHRHAQFLQIHFIQNHEVHFHIDDRFYQVQAPACFLTPATLPHSFKIASDASGHVITIHQSIVWDLLSERMPNDFESALKTGFCVTQTAVTDEQTGEWTNLERIVQAIQQEWRDDRAGKSLVAESLVRAMLIVLLRLSPNTQAGRELTNHDFKLYRKFSDCLEAHYADHKPLRFYVDALNISESRLNQVCQRMGNDSPKRLINDRILQEARRMLRHTSQTSNEIAYELGFKDPSYFSRFFKKHTGQTTQYFRKNSRI